MHSPGGRVGLLYNVSDYLRARGGTSRLAPADTYVSGLSPRTRRNPVYRISPILGGGSISAHAEEPEQLLASYPRLPVYLRARGGTSLEEANEAFLQGLSPRTRRNRSAGPAHHRHSRSISAHAEEPRVRLL
ncbi:Hypothetical protein GbCGDNIH9_8027 [Granulibacter bethesdensis]|uniref:Uncharacterized protein n=1 Tax=Granulibacter bethesdensis TaxID=364410 RepID=A0AAC9KA88_9PROT|nr:Hypothetical protein GbCGDNIH9_8027 [Granulibacter bethesdensis]APH62512.1 Hypothetical protein GbCGDNIH8_7112a [Granulibacter bethesdensis]